MRNAKEIEEKGEQESGRQQRRKQRRLCDRISGRFIQPQKGESFSRGVLICVCTRECVYVRLFERASTCVCDLVCAWGYVCVRKLSTTPGERVPVVCQPNGQKLGHGELFNSFLGGRGDASDIFL